MIIKARNIIMGFYLLQYCAAFVAALVAVPYAAKNRHTSLPPPQPLGGISFFIFYRKGVEQHNNFIAAIK